MNFKIGSFPAKVHLSVIGEHDGDYFGMAHLTVSPTIAQQGHTYTILQQGARNDFEPEGEDDKGRTVYEGRFVYQEGVLFSLARITTHDPIIYFSWKVEHGNPKVVYSKG